MPASNGTSWKLIAAFGAVAAFMISIMTYRTNDMDARLRALEIEQAKLWCAVNPETCMGGRNALKER